MNASAPPAALVRLVGRDEIAARCTAEASEINEAGGVAVVHRRRVVIAATTIGTWALLVPTLATSLPFVRHAARPRLVEALKAADDYLERHQTATD